MRADAIVRVIEELRPLVGGRIQKVDRIGEREIVLSIRVPGRTLRLLINFDLARVHLVQEKASRTVPGGGLQKALRERLEGKPLLGLSFEDPILIVDALDVRLNADFRKKSVAFAPPPGLPIPDLGTLALVPDTFPISMGLDREYGAVGPEEAEKRLKTVLLKRISKEAQRLSRLVQNLEKDRNRLLGMVESGKRGELLKTVLQKIERGATEVLVTDWETNDPIRIAIDPALSAKANMERLFAKSKKGARGVPIVGRRFDTMSARLAKLVEERAQIEQASGDELHRLAEGVDDGAKVVERSSSKEGKKKPIDRWSRKFLARDGSEIRVGRGAEENDRLTLNGTRGYDLWLHARGTAGAHVVLRLEKGKTPDPEAVLDAAHLAAFFSSAKNDSKVEVIHTEAKHVKKNKGDPPGRVSVAKGTTILIDMDRARLDRLLGRDR